MEITGARRSSVDVRLSASVRTGAGTIGDRGGIRVEVDTKDLTGVGETAPIPGQPGPKLEHLAEEIGRWCQTAVGTDAEHQLGTLDEHGLTPIARFAVHTALADLVARSREMPASQWLRSGAATRVKVNGLVGDTNPAAVHERTRELVALRMSAIKLKVGAVDPSMDITRIVAASEAAGGQTELRLDANGAWSIETAIRVIGRVGKHRLSFIEDPTPNPADFGRVQQETGVDVALDVTAETDLSKALDEAQVSIIVVKPAALGGIDRLLRLARERDDLRLIVSSSIQREVGLAAAVHAAAALPHRASGPHGLATGKLIRGMDPSLVDANGEVRVPAGPGIWNESVSDGFEH